MNKQEFRELFLSRKATFKTDGVKISTDNTIVTKRSEFAYTGSRAQLQTVDYAWRWCRRNEYFYIGEEYYSIQNRRTFTAEYKVNGKLAYYSFCAPEDKDAISYAQWKLNTKEMRIVRHDQNKRIEIYNNL